MFGNVVPIGIYADRPDLCMIVQKRWRNMAPSFQFEVTGKVSKYQHEAQASGQSCALWDHSLALRAGIQVLNAPSETNKY